MSKYIIRNCSAIQQGTCEKYGMCQDCTDCLLKRIVKKCKDELGSVRTIGKDIMAEEILELIDIQEMD